MLKAEGRHSAEQFLLSHVSDVGVRDTADLDALLAEV